MVKMKVRSSKEIAAEILDMRQSEHDQDKKLQELRDEYMRLEQSQAAQEEIDALREIGLEQRQRVESLQEHIRALEKEFHSIADATGVSVTVYFSLNRLSLFLRSLPPLLSLENLFRFPGPLDRFLPEECLAELDGLHRRLLKKNLSQRQIRFQMLSELSKVIWAFYVPMKLDNLRFRVEQQVAKTDSTVLLILGTAIVIRTVAKGLNPKRRA